MIVGGGSAAGGEVTMAQIGISISDNGTVRCGRGKTWSTCGCSGKVTWEIDRDEGKQAICNACGAGYKVHLSG